MELLAALVCAMLRVYGIAAPQTGVRSVWALAVLYLLSLLFVFHTASVAAYLTMIVIHGAIRLLVWQQKLRKRLKLVQQGAGAAMVMLWMASIHAKLDRVWGASIRTARRSRDPARPPVSA